MRSFFVSDVHLGSASSEAGNAALEQRFLLWLDMVHRERGRIYLLGDIFDFWFEYNYVIPTSHVAVLARLKAMVSDGIEIHFFKGNHDMWLRGYLSNEIGLIIHNRSELMNIDNENVFMGHGHDLCFKRSFTTRALWFLFNESFIYNFFSAILHPNLMMRIGQAWSKSSRAKKHICHEFRGEEEYLTSYLTSRLSEFGSQGVTRFIFGHFHCPVLYTLVDGHSQMMILGEWSSVAMYGTLSDGKFELHSWL